MGTQYLGKYLRDVRLERKADNIQDYLQKHKVHVISESYYRAVESGKNNIKIDTALELCHALELDANSFFYCLLKDILDENVFEALIKPKIIDNSAERVFEAMRKKLDMYHHAFKKNFVREQFYATDHTAKFLCENIDLLPLVHFIYMREAVSFQEIEVILCKNSIRKEIKEVIAVIKKYNLAEVDEENETITKHGQDFSAPRTDDGDKLKRDFLTLETNKTINKKANHQNRVIINTEDSYVFCGIKCINFDRNKDDFERYITDLVACFNASVEPLEDEHSVPFFFSVIVSPRKEYDSKTN